jgi:acetoin utilization deacetylase AcuC-like enzyme
MLTAAVLKNDPSVFTFSVHGKNNFPYKKETGDRDIALNNGTTDRAYLNALQKGVEYALSDGHSRSKISKSLYLSRT